VAAVNEFQKYNFDSQFIRQHALKFNRNIFKEKIKDFVEKGWEEFKLSL